MRWTLISIVFVFLIVQFLGKEKPNSLGVNAFFVPETSRWLRSKRQAPEIRPPLSPQPTEGIMLRPPFSLRGIYLRQLPPPLPQPTERIMSLPPFSLRQMPSTQCDHECLGNNRCRHVTVTVNRILTGTCFARNCAGVTEQCGPCWEQCPIDTEPKCEYNCEEGPNRCSHNTTYPPGTNNLAWRLGYCIGTNCVGDTEECGKCYEQCDNIRTEPQCEYDCISDAECSHRSDFNGQRRWGGCYIWGWGRIQIYCNGESDVCPSCAENCFDDSE